MKLSFISKFNLITLTVLNIFLAPVQANDKKVQEFIHTTYNKVILIMNSNEPLPRKKNKIKQIIANVTDFKQMTDFVLSNHKKSVSPKDYADFSKAYKAYLLRYYSSIFSKFNHQKFIIKNTNTLVEGKTYVLTNVIDDDSNNVMHVNFLINTASDQYMVFDIVNDGISLISAQRSEFNSVINQQGLRVLINRLTKLQ